MKSRFSAAILGLTLGIFGINNFYTNNVSKGIIDILVSVLLSWTVIAPLIVTLINTVRACQYLWCIDDYEFNNKYVAGMNNKQQILTD